MARMFGSKMMSPYRKRVYFTDPEGNDWEFVQYSSDDPAERNDYEHPDIT